MAVNGTHGFESQKKTYTDKTKLNPAARDHQWGLKTRNNRSVQETEQYLYHFLPLINRNVQLSWARSPQPARDTSMCSGTVDACVEAICRTYTSLIICTVQRDCGCVHWHCEDLKIFRSTGHHNGTRFWYIIRQRGIFCPTVFIWTRILGARTPRWRKQQHVFMLTRHAPAVVNAFRTVGHCGGSEVKNYINAVQFLARTDCFVS